MYLAFELIYNYSIYLVNFQFFLSAPNSDRKSGNVDIKKDSGDEFGAYSIFLNWPWLP